MADEFDQYTRKPQSSGQDEFAQYARKPSDDSLARHGATGSWGGLVEGAADAVSAPFKAENWKSLTDNPIVNPYLAQPHDMVTPSDVKDIGRMPSRYEVGNMAGNAVMAGAPEILGSGMDAALPRPVNLADGDVRSPGFGSRIVAGVKAGGPDVAKGIAQVGGAGLLDMATPSSARMVTGFGTLPLVRSGLRDIGRGVRSGMGEFRGPAYGPEIAPKGFVSPYDTFSKYEPPMPPIGPRQVNTLPSGRMAPVLPFSGPEFTPTALDRQPSVGKPGAVLPSGSIVGPASPSRVNPPEPRGNAPRVPLRVQIGISNAQGPEALPDLSPIYPSGGILPSGRVAGPVALPRGEPNPNAVVLNGMRPEPVTNAKFDTPGTIKSRVNQSRAKFDANGKRNQLK